MVQLGKNALDDAALFIRRDGQNVEFTQNLIIDGNLTVIGSTIVPIVDLANNVYLQAANAAGTGFVGLIKADATDNTVVNAITGKIIKFAINSVTELTLGANNLTFTSALFAINANTADASDTSGLILTGGGATGTTRGANILVYGNEAVSAGGYVQIEAGNVANSKIYNYLSAASSTWGILNNSAALMWSMDTTGALTQDATNGGNIVFAKAAGGIVNKVSAAVAAAGTTLGTATVLTSTENVVSSGTALQGVALNTASAVGQTVNVTSTVSGNTVNLYPEAAGTSLVLNGVSQGAGNPIAIGLGVQYRLTKLTSTTWGVSSFSSAGTVSAAVAAAGTTLGTATVLTSTENVVTSGTAAQGVTLSPGAAVGQTQLIVSTVSANQVLLYPDSASNTITFNGVAAGAGISVPLIYGALYRATKTSATNWTVTSAAVTPLVTSTNATLTGVAVNVNINASGANAINLQTNTLTRVSITSGGDVSTDVTNGGNILINTAGKGLQVKSGGAAAKSGTVTANGTTGVTVSTTGYTANSTVSFGLKTTGGTPAGIYVFSVVAGTSFTIKGVAGDTSVYNWVITDLI